jgi:hypothetical protein
MNQKVKIGDVAVCEGMPPKNNPYLEPDTSKVKIDIVYGGSNLNGGRRVEALTKFKNGGDTSEWTFWFAPSGGGAYQLQSPNEVDWETSGIK